MTFQTTKNVPNIIALQHIIEYNTNTGSNLMPMFCSCISQSDQVGTSNSLLLLDMEVKR